MEITEELKEKLKEERLLQYKARIFQIQMDIVAYEAVQDTKRLDIAMKQLEDLTTAHDAVLVM